MQLFFFFFFGGGFSRGLGNLEMLRNGSRTRPEVCNYGKDLILKLNQGYWVQIQHFLA
jgi:hypothetical protein